MRASVFRIIRDCFTGATPSPEIPDEGNLIGVALDFIPFLSNKK